MVDLGCAGLVELIRDVLEFGLVDLGCAGLVDLVRLVWLDGLGLCWFGRLCSSLVWNLLLWTLKTI